jgi:transcriptional regulator with XRE-family HTH domain
LLQTQPLVKSRVAFYANDAVALTWLWLRMAPVAKIHKGKQPHQFHFIPEWAEKRKVSQADIARELAVEKSTVTRWFAGVVPTNKHLVPLAAFLTQEDPPDPTALFRHPDEDWLTRLFRSRAAEDRKDFKEMIELAMRLGRRSR